MSVEPKEAVGVAGGDEYVLREEQVQEPPGGLWTALRQIGPGLILAGSIVGTGELIATTHLGAKVGFVLLWMVIASCFIKVFVQAELGRFAISSGRTTMQGFGELPVGGTVVAWCWMIMMFCTQAQLATVVGGVGQAMHMVLPGVSGGIAKVVGMVNGGWGQYVAANPEIPWAIVVAVGTSIILAVGGYGIVEKGSTWLVMTFTLATVACVALLPAAGHPIEWGEVAGGLKFRIPREAVAAAFAMLGLTGVGAAELVAYPYWCIEKGYARKTGTRDDSEAWLARAKGWLRVMQLDAWVSMGIYTVATVAFYFLGAAVLHGGNPKGLPGNVKEMLVTLSGMYRPVLGAAAVWFIVVGVFAVLYSTLYSATAANSRALADFTKTNLGVSFEKGGTRKKVVRWMVIGFPILDLALYLKFRNPVAMVLFGGFAQAMALPMIAGAAVYLRYRRTDRRLVSGRAWDVFLWLSLVGLAAAAGYGLWDTIGKIGK